MYTRNRESLKVVESSLAARLLTKKGRIRREDRKTSNRLNPRFKKLWDLRELKKMRLMRSLNMKRNLLPMTGLKV